MPWPFKKKAPQTPQLPNPIVTPEIRSSKFIGAIPVWDIPETQRLTYVSNIQGSLRREYEARHGVLHLVMRPLTPEDFQVLTWQFPQISPDWRTWINIDIPRFSCMAIYRLVILSRKPTVDMVRFEVNHATRYRISLSDLYSILPLLEALKEGGSDPLSFNPDELNKRRMEAYLTRPIILQELCSLRIGVTTVGVEAGSMLYIGGFMIEPEGATIMP